MVRRNARRRAERGSISTELVVLVPVLVLFLLIAVALGRYESVRQQVIGAARAAADAAAVVSSPSQAQAAAYLAAGSVVTARWACAGLVVSTDVSRFVPGGVVRVDVTCRIDLSDLVVPGLPGATSVSSVQVATIDPYRAVQ